MATLSQAQLNALPDSAFAYVEDGGTKDSEGKTVPRSLRHYAIHDAAHVRDALSRAAAAKNAGGATAAIAGHALANIESAAKRMGIGQPAARSMMDTPGDAQSMCDHMAGGTPGGHGTAASADTPMADLQKAHDALHAAGAGHAHGTSGRAEEFSLRDGSFLVRTLPPEFDYGDGESVRAVDFTPSDGGDSPGMLSGRFAVFDTWTEVRSQIEGHFMERTGDGAFRKALSEGRPPIIFNHGWHPQVGTAPIARTEDIGTDQRGGYYGGPLYRGMPELIVSGLRDGAYGSSYRFRSIRPEVIARPKPSDHNPLGLPEVTVREAAIKEVGPGMFPVYKETTAIVRSETDEYLLSRFGDPEHVLSLLAAQRGDPAPPDDGADVSHSAEGSRTDPPPAAPSIDRSHPRRFRDRDEWLDYLQNERPTF